MHSSKNLSWFILLVISFVSLSKTEAQDLPVDESGKIFFSEVVLADSFPKEKLFKNSLVWLNSLNRPEEKFEFSLKDSIQSSTIGHFEFQVFAQGGMLRKMVGLIKCTVSIDTKDNKYRYAFSDFAYHYYKEDRNYKMIKTGKTKPLEDTEAKGWQRLWDKHKQTTYTKITVLISSLKSEIPKKVVVHLKKEKKIEW
jgi:hypothetical protein